MLGLLQSFLTIIIVRIKYEIVKYIFMRLYLSYGKWNTIVQSISTKVLLIKTNLNPSEDITSITKSAYRLKLTL